MTGAAITPRLTLNTRLPWTTPLHLVFPRSFTVDALRRFTLIEKCLTDLGASGHGLYQKAKSLPKLPRELRGRLRSIARERNKLLHEHDYVFTGDKQYFLSLCDSVIAWLSSMAPQRSPDRSANLEQRAFSKPSTKQSQPPTPPQPTSSSGSETASRCSG